MFGVALSQDTNTARNSNALPNSNQARGNGKPFASGNRSYRHPGANRSPWNGSWNTNRGNGDFDGNAAGYNAANVTTNGVHSNAVNVARPVLRRKQPIRKKARRPSAGLGGALTLGNTLSAMLAAGVSSDLTK